MNDVLPTEPAAGASRRQICAARISLVLLGVTLQGCESPPPPPAPVVRDRYVAESDCAADWGRPESCEREDEPDAASASNGQTGSSHGGGVGFYRGPAYYADAREPAQREAISRAMQQGVAVDASGNRSVGRVSLGSLGDVAGRAGGLGATSRGGFGASGRALGASAS